MKKYATNIILLLLIAISFTPGTFTANQIITTTSGTCAGTPSVFSFTDGISVSPGSNIISLDASTLAKGIYFVKVVLNRNSLIKKFTKL